MKLCLDTSAQFFGAAQQVRMAIIRLVERISALTLDLSVLQTSKAFGRYGEFYPDDRDGHGHRNGQYRWSGRGRLWRIVGDDGGSECRRIDYRQYRDDAGCRLVRRNGDGGSYLSVRLARERQWPRHPYRSLPAAAGQCQLPHQL